MKRDRRWCEGDRHSVAVDLPVAADRPLRASPIRCGEAAEAVVIPLARAARGDACVRRLPRCCSAKSPLERLRADLARRLRQLVLAAEHAAARRAPDADGALRGAAGAGSASSSSAARARSCSAARGGRASALPLAGAAAAARADRAWRSAAMLVGGVWIALAGALRHYRGVNETITSLLLTYIAIALFNHLVEGPLRDPASLNKPSTPPIGDAYMLGPVPGMDVHWGLVSASSPACCLLRPDATRPPSASPRASSAAMSRAAQLQGLPVGRLIVIACVLGGACGRARRHDRGRGRARAAPTPRSSRATATPASSSPSSRATIRSPSSRSRSCSAASRQRRPAAAAHGPARRDRARAAGHRSFMMILAERDALRALQAVPAARELTMDDRGVSAGGACRSPCSAAPSASARRSCSSASANA